MAQSSKNMSEYFHDIAPAVSAKAPVPVFSGTSFSAAGSLCSRSPGACPAFCIKEFSCPSGTPLSPMSGSRGVVEGQSVEVPFKD